MAVLTQQRTKVIETFKVDPKKTTKKAVEDKLGRALGSPINGKQVGEQFEVTLTGEIQISEFGGRKSAHFLTKEGYKIAVNAAFDPTVHSEGKQFTAVCREVELERDGQMTKIKFSAFVD